MVPFENSTNGSVVFTLDLFADLHNKYSDILVCGEAYVSVSHCLLGLDASTSTDYSKITKLYSHPQAWGQCKTFLQTHLKHAERFDVSSTSRAAQIVADSKDPSAAAISSKVAGTLFNLSLLSEGINDVSGNQTRFLSCGAKTTPRPRQTQMCKRRLARKRISRPSSSSPCLTRPRILTRALWRIVFLCSAGIN